MRGWGRIVGLEALAVAVVLAACSGSPMVEPGAGDSAAPSGSTSEPAPSGPSGESSSREPTPMDVPPTEPSDGPEGSGRGRFPSDPQGDGSSTSPQVAADAIVAAFQTTAPNFRPAARSEVDGWSLVVRDVAAGEATRLPIEDGRLSDDGRFVLHGEAGSRVRELEVATGIDRIVFDGDPEAEHHVEDVSRDRQVLLIVARTSSSRRLLRFDRRTGTEELVTDGFVASGALSGDGRSVAYWLIGPCDDATESRTERLQLFDAETDRTQTITERTTKCNTGGYTDVASFTIGLDRTGSVVVFDTSEALGVRDRDTGFDVYAWFQHEERFSLVSGAEIGWPEDEASIGHVSADGRYASYVANARDDPFCDPPAGENGGCMRIVVRDLRTGTAFAGSVAADGGPPNADVMEGPLSSDGRYLIFATTATNVIRGRPPCQEPDGDACSQVYLRDLRRGRTILASSI